MNKEEEQIQTIEIKITDANLKLKKALDELSEKEKLEIDKDNYEKILEDNERVRLSCETSKEGIKYLKKRYLIEIITLNAIMMVIYSLIPQLPARVIVFLASIVPSCILLKERGNLNQKIEMFDSNIGKTLKVDDEVNKLLDDTIIKLLKNSAYYNEVEDYIIDLNTWLDDANELLSNLREEYYINDFYDGKSIREVPKRKRKRELENERKS